MNKNKKTFICEICKCVTPKEYESYEKNVCEDCLPNKNDSNTLCKGEK